MAFSFSFSKKAEPKRVVEALVTKKADDREEICGLDSGEVTVDAPKEAAKKLTIACKNPLDELKAAKAAPKAATTVAPAAGESKALPKNVDDLPAGLIARNMEKLSADDAEAMRELLKDAKRGDDDVEDEPAVPILMREGSKRARGSDAPEATKDQFERVGVETFGEALLRGMGYDPAVHTTKPVFRDKQRDSKLGLGAKALLPSEKMPKKKAKTGDAAAGAVKAVASSAPPLVTPAPTAAQAADAQSVDVDLTKEKAFWPSRGLVVRVVGRGATLRDFYGAEAVVLEADEASRCCRVKARPTAGANKSEGKSQVLQGVRLEELETRVSRDCASVRVVNGPHRGAVAKLVLRDVARGMAVVQIEGAESEMPLDAVCQFMG